MFTIQKDIEDKWYKNSSGEIVTKDNISTYIPKLTTDDAKYQLIGLQNIQNEINATMGSWDDCADRFKKNEKYLLDYARTHNVLKSSVDDLKGANENARKSAIAHNNALKQQTLGAKATTVALKALSIAGNMIAMWAISKVVEIATNCLDNFIHSAENTTSALEESADTFKDTTSEIEDYNSELETTQERIEELQRLVKNGTISVAEKDELKLLQKQNDELQRKILLTKEQQALEAKQLLKSLNAVNGNNYSVKMAGATWENGVLGKTSAVDALQTYINQYSYWSDTANATEDQVTESQQSMLEVADAVYQSIEAYQSLIEFGYADELDADYQRLLKVQDAYVKLLYDVNKSESTFAALSATDKRDILSQQLKLQRGFSDEKIDAIISSIEDEDLYKFYNKSLNFTEPTATGYSNIKEYGKAYAEAWLAGIETAIETSSSTSFSLSEPQSEALDTYDKVLENIKKVYQEYEDMDKIDIVKLFEDTGFDFTDFLSGDANLETTLTSLATFAYNTVRKTFSSLSDNDPIIIDLFNKKQGLRGEAFGWEDALHDINTLKPLLEKAKDDTIFTMEELDSYITEYGLSADLLKVDGGYKVDEDAVENLLNKAKEEYNTALALFRTYLREQGFGEEAIDSFFGLLNLYYETIDSSSSSTSDFEQQIDWAAQSISNLEEKVSDLENVLDNTKGWEAQLEAIQDVIEAQEDLQKGYAQARDLYLSEYNNALNSGILAERGLSNSFKKKIESDGLFDIEDFVDENVSKNVDKGTYEQIYDAVQEAMDWYDKYIDADNNYIDIGFQIDKNQLEKLNTEAEHLSAVREKLETALAGTVSDSDKLDLLSQLSTALENDYNKQIEIAQAEKNTEEAEKLQLELKQELYDLDQQRLELSREITESEIEQLKVERTRIENQIDLNGGKGTAEQYQSLIRNENELLAKRTAEYEAEVSLLQKIGEEVGINSTEYREQLKVVNECADGIAECEKNTKEWEIALLSLPLDEIEDKIDELNKKLDDVNDKQSEMDDVIAGAQAYIQDEIDGYEELKQNIQDQIDALQESNDERERALNLQKAQYELERAMSQRTVKLYSGKEKGFIYTQNQDDVRDAKENLSNLEFENTIYQLEKQIDYYDNIIEDLQEIQDAWGNIASDAEDYLNIQKAISALGVDGIFDYEQIDKYAASYQNLVKTTASLENEIKVWEDFKEGLEEIVEKYEYGAYSSLTEAKGVMRDYAHDYLYGLEEYQVLIDGMVDPDKTEEKVNNAVYQIITKYFDGFEEIEQGSAETGETTAENLTEPIENAIDIIEENLEQFQDDVEKLNTALEQDSQEAMEEVEENAASSYAAMTESLRKELSAQRQELDSYKQDLLNLQSSVTSAFQQMFNVISNNLSNSLDTFSNSVYSACSDLESRLSEISDQIQDMPSVEIASTSNSVSSTVLGITGGSNRSTVSFERLATYHTGLDNGYVGEVHSDNKRLKILQMAGEGLLKPDETFAKLQNNELVLTKQQQSNIAKALMNTPYNTALFNASDLGAIASSSKETSVNFGDVNINCPGITSQQVAKQVGVEMQRVIKELPLNTLQYSNRR